MQLEQLAELERQHTQLIEIQVQLAQTSHVSDLGRQSANLVARHVQIVQVGQIGHHGRQPHQVVVVKAQTREMRPLPQLGTNVPHHAFDFDVIPLGLL